MLLTPSAKENRMPKKALLCALIATLALSALAAAASTKPGWTVLVYMLADNDLEESALADLVEMADSGAGSGFELVVLADRECRYSASGAAGVPAWKGASLFAAEGGRLERLADWGKVDMGDPGTLARFIAEGLAARPSERRAFLFWDHGGAWKGFGVDESADSNLTLEEIGTGLAAGLAKAGLARFDLMGFDACLMASYETMSAVGDRAAYFLASEELEPGHGWDYRSLSLLGSKPAAGPVELGKAMIAGFMEQARAERNGDRVTLSLIDLSRAAELDAALADFVGTVQGVMGEAAGGLGRAAGSTLEFGKAGSPERDSHMVDLGSLADAAAKESPALARPAEALKAALSRAVVAVDSGAFLAASSGLSIYFPNRLKLFEKDYSSSGKPQWKGLLVAYYGGAAASSTPAAARIPEPRFSDPDHAGAMELEDDYVWLSGQLEPGCAAGVVDAVLYYGLVEDGVTYYLGDETAHVDQATGRVEGGWDLTILYLRQNKKEAYGYLSATEQEGGTYLYSVPFAYFADGKIDDEEYDYAYLDLVVDENEEVLSSTLYKEDDEGMTAELRPVKGSKLVPLVDVLDEEGEEYMEMTEDWGFDARNWETIELDFEELGSGDVISMELQASDAADNYDYVSCEFELD